MEQNPIEEIFKRLFTVAEAYGTAFGKLTFDAEKQEFKFNIIPNDQVIIKYEQE